LSANGLLQALAARADDAAPFLHFLERRWSRRQIWQQSQSATAGLAALPGDAERPVGLLLPNLPAAVTALVACWRAGRTAAPVDGRRAMEDLHAWSGAMAPSAIVTLDLASVFERARALAAVRSDCTLIVVPMASQLSLAKRLISPWLRGGGFAKRPDDVCVVQWSDLDGPPPSVAGTVRARLESGSWEPSAPLSWPEGRLGLLSCPLADAAALEALVAAWCDGGRLVLSPRLDRRSLDKVRKAARPSLEVGAAA